jgi:hypothetical protein
MRSSGIDRWAPAAPDPTLSANLEYGVAIVHSGRNAPHDFA